MNLPIDLDNKIWPSLHGGYKIPYNASTALKKLRDTNQAKDYNAIFTELWDNLHHQGDVGLASYLALPHLVSICIAKNSLDWNYIGLCVLIENCRLKGDNPEIPKEYQDHYFQALTTFERYLLSNFKTITDRTATRLALALLATLNGLPELGRAIEILDEDEVPNFLENY